MKIGNKHYRIKEEVYKDGHKEYIAQQEFNLFFFKLWLDFIYEDEDGLYDMCCIGDTYEECKQKLIDILESKEKEDDKEVIVSTNYYY